MFKSLRRWWQRRKENATKAIASGEQDIEAMQQSSEQASGEWVAYDEDLLERARTQWQFGDWESLASLQRDTLQHHPDRAKLALLAAAGHQQQGDMAAARQFAQIAKDWGASKKSISQVLIAGVYSTLASSFYITNNLSKTDQYSKKSLSIVSLHSENRLLHKARLLALHKDLEEKKNTIERNKSAYIVKAHTPCLSIVIPIYNNPIEQIESCLISIKDQTEKDFEVILVDDGSSINISTYKSILLNERNIKKIRLKDNLGPGPARNKGLSNSQGYYVRFIDADDTLPANSFSSLLNISNDSDLVRGSTIVKTSSKKHYDLCTHSEITNKKLFDLDQEIISKFLYGHTSALIKNSFLKENKIYYPNQRNSEDTKFLTACAFHANTVSATPEFVYKYIKNDLSISNHLNNIKNFDFFYNVFERWEFAFSLCSNEKQTSAISHSFKKACNNYISQVALRDFEKHLNIKEIERLESYIQSILSKNNLTNISTKEILEG